MLAFWRVSDDLSDRRYQLPHNPFGRVSQFRLPLEGHRQHTCHDRGTETLADPGVDSWSAGLAPPQLKALGALNPIRLYFPVNFNFAARHRESAEFRGIGG